jgi:hypothetical protein
VCSSDLSDYCLIVKKGSQRWHVYNDDDSAYGMCSFIVSKISRCWWEKDNSKSN